MHRALDFDSQVADLVTILSVVVVQTLECHNYSILHKVPCIIRESEVEVCVVSLVLKVCVVPGLNGNVSSQDDCSKGLDIHTEWSL